ncbi:molybdenum cofactor guanylyltransferase MobA [Isoalcanivorax indicus]|uniref:molybdenum cofactor guanylyltransferase MobA n=1 Tax=Isoalcanivorax indicus TaxID=2202653 RepID=UPI0013C47638|nr:molybdenum cofactor guanylyltransferase MobA [Isoalcanivorax indicus]
MPVCSLILLAGGAGRRMGGVDKGLLPLEGQPLISHLLSRFAGGHQVLISANRNQLAYHALGSPDIKVCPDLRPDFPGPLAGIEACLPFAQHDRCVVLPCDMPWLPENLVQALLDARHDRAQISTLHDGERRQPLCMAFSRRHWANNLRDYLDHGGRSVHGWLDDKPVIDVRVKGKARDFDNLNTPDAWPH